MLAALERFGTTDGPDIVFAPARCLHERDPFATCDLCVEACPAGALQFADDGIIFDNEACVACGVCLPLCPVGAFSGPTGAAEVLRFAKHLADGQTLELLCARHPQPETGPPQTDIALSTSGCLAALGPSVYVGLAALGVAHVAVRTDACADCPLAAARQTIDLNVEKAQRILKAWERADAVAVVLPDRTMQPRPVVEADKPLVGRRQLFRAIFNTEADNPAADALLADDLGDADTPGRRYPPLERRRLQRALALLPPVHPQALCPAPLAGQAFSTLGAGPACTACGVCAEVCPTGALQLVLNDDTDEFVLAFLPSACTGCDACLHLCDVDALYHNPVPFVADIVADEHTIIHSGTFQRCQKCGTRTAGQLSDRGLCPVCEFRRQHPFGSQLPAKMRRKRT
jgi:ferredoxin